MLLALSLQLVLRHALADAVGELEHTGDAHKVQPLVDVRTVSGKLPAARQAKPSWRTRVRDIASRAGARTSRACCHALGALSRAAQGSAHPSRPPCTWPRRVQPPLRWRTSRGLTCATRCVLRRQIRHFTLGASSATSSQQRSVERRDVLTSSRPWGHIFGPWGSHLRPLGSHRLLSRVRTQLGILSPHALLARPSPTYPYLGSVFWALIPYCGPSVFWGAFCIPYCVLRIPHIILGPDLYSVLCICTIHDSQLSCVNSHPLQQFGSACVLRIAYPYCVFRCVG